MLTLYSGSGSQSFGLVTRFYESLEPQILSQTCQLLIARGETMAARIVASEDFEIWEAQNDFNDSFYVLSTNRNIAGYEEWRKILDYGSEEREIYAHIFQKIANTMNELGISPYDDAMYVRFIVCYLQSNDIPEDGDWKSEIIAATGGAKNQALFDFKDATKLTKDGLNFRSKTEIRMYDALIRRNLLIFPLPVAILGNTKSKREPDFVIAYKGKIGILEINGERWHPAETSAKEAERRRSLRNLGVAVYEVFDAARCWNDPDTVINDFLHAFD